MSTSDHEEHLDDTVDDELEAEDQDSESEYGEEDDAEEAPAEKAPVPAAEPEFYIEEVEDGDHRVARLRKYREQFVGDDDLSLPESAMLTADDTGPSLIVCPNCNSEEINGQKFCSQCNARLPNIVVIEQKYNPGSVDGAARKYHDAVNKLRSGTQSPDDFADFLTKELERVKAYEENLGEISEDGVIGEWLPAASNLLVTATQRWYDAVDAMLGKVEDAGIEFDQEQERFLELEDDELEERDEPVPWEERVRGTDFTPELNAIFQANDEMLEYLRILDSSLKTEVATGGMQF